jgi:hypothetical protein
MTEEERYQQAWKRRRFWNRLADWSSALALITFFLLLYFLYHGPLPTPFVVVGSLCFGAAVTAGFIYGRLRCPRCDHRFSVTPPRQRSIWFLPYCANCGLPEGSGPGPFIHPDFQNYSAMFPKSD